MWRGGKGKSLKDEKRERQETKRERRQWRNGGRDGGREERREEGWRRRKRLQVADVAFRSDISV